MLAPVLTAIETVEKQAERILQRWASTYSNARMEALNGIFKAARARARGYRNTQTFTWIHTNPAGSLDRLSGEFSKNSNTFAAVLGATILSRDLLFDNIRKYRRWRQHSLPRAPYRAV